MAPVTIEFLLVSFLAFALVAALASSLASEVIAAREKAQEFTAISRAAAVACALEAAFNSGADVDFDYGNRQHNWRAERGVLHASYDDRVVEVRGVFSDDRSEPI